MDKLKNEFQFVLSITKFAESGIVISGTATYNAKQKSNDTYGITWDNQTDEAEYSSTQVADNIEQGFWIIKE